MEVVTPGQVIKSGEGFLRGHGTYVSDGKLVASVAGVVQRVNKLVAVVPLKTRYSGPCTDPNPDVLSPERGKRTCALGCLS